VSPTHATLGGDGKVPADQLSAGGGGSPAWGSITGTLSDQTDLGTALSGVVLDYISLGMVQLWEGD